MKKPAQPLKGLALQRQLLTKAIKPTTDPGVQRSNEQRFDVLRNLPTPLGPGDRPSVTPTRTASPMPNSIGAPMLDGRQAAPMPDQLTVRDPGVVKSLSGQGQSVFGPGTSNAGNVGPIRDLPTPGIPQTSTDQMFLEGIRNKPMGDLTPDEIQTLIQIKQRQAEEQSFRDLSSTYEPLLDASGREIDRLTGELKTTQQTEAERVAAELNRSFGLVDTKYAPELESIQRQGASQLEDTQRTFSAAGSGRGSRGLEARQNVERQTAQIDAAKRAEIALEKRLLQAQIEGESDAVINNIAKQIDAAKTARSTLEAQQAADMSTLRANLAATGQNSVAAFLQNLQTQASLQSYDAGLSAATGQIVDSQGRPIMGPDGKPLTPGAVPPEASAEISKQLGYLADKNGGAILDTNGQPIPINKNVKSTFQDGAKNTYILYEDGTTQQIGAPGGRSGGGSGGSGSGSGYDSSLAAVYSDIASYASDNGVSYTQAVDALGYGTSKGVRESLIMGTDAYVNDLIMNMPPAEAAPTGIEQLISGYSTLTGIKDKVANPVKTVTGGVLNWLFN